MIDFSTEPVLVLREHAEAVLGRGTRAERMLDRLLV